MHFLEKTRNMSLVSIEIVMLSMDNGAIEQTKKARDPLPKISDIERKTHYLSLLPLFFLFHSFIHYLPSKQ